MSKAIVLAAFLMAGCSVVPQEVLVPVKCDIPQRDRPMVSSGIVENIKNLLIYTEGLEQDIAFCRGIE